MESKIDHSLEDYKQLCVFAFDVLVATLKKIDHEKLKFPDVFINKSYPLFVTWSIGQEKILRGCIGTFSPENLQKNLLAYSYCAAFKDNRFKPISIKDIPHLHCGVSLLVNFEDGSDALDWEVGKHGITIEFHWEYKSHRATFLPEVAKDRNWDKKTTLKNLIHKAGFNGKLDEIMEIIKLTRYQSIKIEISHDEYKCHKQSINQIDFLIY